MDMCTVLLSNILMVPIYKTHFTLRVLNRDCGRNMQKERKEERKETAEKRTVEFYFTPSPISWEIRVIAVHVLCWFLCPWDSPGKNAEVGCHALLQGIFLTQGLSSSLLCFLYWQADSLLHPAWDAPISSDLCARLADTKLFNHQLRSPNVAVLFLYKYHYQQVSSFRGPKSGAMENVFSKALLQALRHLGVGKLPSS